jgi:hypothetical protein
LLDATNSHESVPGWIRAHLTAEGLARIIQAVGPKVTPVQSPSRPGAMQRKDKDLRSNLLKSVQYYYGAVERRSDRNKRDRIRRLQSIVNAADRLAELLKPVDGWDWAIGDHADHILFEIENLNVRARFELEDLHEKLVWGDDADRMGFGASRDLMEKLKTRSPFEWFAGAYLPETYRQCFGKEPTLHRRVPEGKLDGPYIRFAEQVLIEFGITKNGRPYGREAIARALTDVKNNRSRRPVSRIGQTR